jgi:hypothetical protein
MPSVSEPQHRAMEAAAHGHSTLGIPKSVGQDFADADKGKTFNMGGEIGSIPTIGTSASYPPPPGQRKQGPRNYGKKE